MLQHRLATGSQHPLAASTSSRVGSSTGCRWMSAPPWTSMGCRGTACLTVVFIVGCKGISAPAPGAPPPPPSSLTLVSAELFLVHILTPLFGCCKIVLVFVPLIYVIRMLLGGRCGVNLPLNPSEFSFQTTAIPDRIKKYNILFGITEEFQWERNFGGLSSNSLLIAGLTST